MTANTTAQIMAGAQNTPGRPSGDANIPPTTPLRIFPAATAKEGRRSNPDTRLKDALQIDRSHTMNSSKYPDVAQLDHINNGKPVYARKQAVAKSRHPDRQGHCPLGTNPRGHHPDHREGDQFNACAQTKQHPTGQDGVTEAVDDIDREVCRLQEITDKHHTQEDTDENQTAPSFVFRSARISTLASFLRDLALAVTTLGDKDDPSVKNPRGDKCCPYPTDLGHHGTQERAGCIPQ
ncbi:hypothetical protein NKH18_16420 [Streptomyces sp. M10(2022)]